MRWRRGAGRGSAPEPDLTTCASCGSERVIAGTWTRRDEQSWWIDVRCSHCGASRGVLVSDAAAKRYDRGMHAIARALDRLERDCVR